jgi:hypothetical protein
MNLGNWKSFISDHKKPGPVWGIRNLYKKKRSLQREAYQSEANLVDERAELGDGVFPVADNLEGGLLLPGELAHARLLKLQLLAQLQLNLPLKRRQREIFKPKT